MPERFNCLFKLPGRMYAENSPLVIEGGALLFDRKLGSVFAQLKFHSVSEEAVTAVKISISAYDAFGTQVQGVGEYQYLDLHISNGEAFGSDVAILLPDRSARSFSISGFSAALADGSTWTMWDSFKPLPDQKELIAGLNRPELVEQYRSEVNSRAKYIPCKLASLWLCSCGNVNGAEVCTDCRAHRESVFSAYDISRLNEHNLAREELKRTDMEKRKAKKKKGHGPSKIIERAVPFIFAAAVLALALFQIPGERLAGSQNAEPAAETGPVRDGGDGGTRRAKHEDKAEIQQTPASRVILNQACIAAGRYQTLCLKTDGTVFASSPNWWNEASVESWSNIKAVAAGEMASFGIKTDGTVIATGNNSSGQCDVQGWTDIVSISAAEKHTIGLKSNGTVVATGNDQYGQCQVSGWSGIVCVATSRYHTVGLKADGTVVAVGYNGNMQCQVQDWTNIVKVAADFENTYGLRADGTVLVAGGNSYGQSAASAWSDIIDIDAKYYRVTGLKSDGTLVTAGEVDNSGLEEWTDVVQIVLGSAHTVGLKSDGTVLAGGYSDFGMLIPISGWSGVRIPAGVS